MKSDQIELDQDCFPALEEETERERAEEREEELAIIYKKKK